MSDAVDRIRNLGIVAHINAGKTTLGERILFDCGRVRFLGEVDEGTAALDYLPQEQKRGISIRAASTSVRWRDHLLNLVDTPGHVDFGAEVARALRVLDGVVLVLDGVRGVESQTEAVWRQVRALGLPALAFINKLDRPVAEWGRALEAMRNRLGVRVVPVVVPIVGPGGLSGLVDVIAGVRQEWADGGMPALDPARARQQLVEAAADFDSSVLEDFALDRFVASERLRAALRVGVGRCELALAFAGSALRNRGVDVLLDGICQYLPSPLDRPPARGVGGEERSASSAAPMCALVFGRAAEDDEPALAVRVYSGCLRAGTVASRSDGADQVRVRGVGRMHADHQEPIAEAGPGDIVALVVDGANVPAGVTLFAPGHPITLAPVAFSPPVLSVAIEPRHPDDAPVVEGAARRLAAGDPTLAVRLDDVRGVLLLSGMGELHLEVAAEQIRAAVGDRFRLGKPEVACKETVRRASAGHGEWRVAEVGARAAVRLSLEPRPGQGAARVHSEAGAGDRVPPDQNPGDQNPGAQVPGAQVPGAQILGERLASALAARLANGLCEGWPAFDLAVRIHSVVAEGPPPIDLLPVAVEAAEVALRRALADAEPVVLQPVGRIEVTCPHDALSPVLGDLRGKEIDILAVDVDGESARVRGTAPLSRLLGYSTRLRSLTRGLGTFHIDHAGFAAFPQGI